MNTPTGPTLRLVLGDQLSPLHSWFGEVRADVVYVLMEVRSETDYVRHHAQKVLGIFAAMRTGTAHEAPHTRKASSSRHSSGAWYSTAVAL